MRLFVAICLVLAADLKVHAQPILSFSRSEAGPRLSWPIWPVDLTVERSAELRTWQALTNTLAFTNNTSELTLPIVDEHEFFRLSGRSTVPVFQYGVFYALDMEITFGPPASISGRVHGNSNLYIAPGNITTFINPVTAAGTIYHSRAPGDPRSYTNSQPIYRAGSRPGTPSMRLSITNDWREILEAPAADDRDTEIGRHRFYNKADVIILVSNQAVTVTSGAFDNFATSLAELAHTNFIRTDVSFVDRRENKFVRATQLDVAQLRNWSATNNSLRHLLLRDVRLLYMADYRTMAAGDQPGVRLVNGQTLPPLGLTLVTPNPLYVRGHFNAHPSHLGTANTSLTHPAALIGDAITILSSNFNDRTTFMGSAASTTVNAALLAGIVPTTVERGFSGGLENFPRLLENWDGRQLTINGSMVALFASRQATGQWGGSGVYSPPMRRWAFNKNFLDVAKLPPGTPMVQLSH